MTSGVQFTDPSDQFTPKSDEDRKKLEKWKAAIPVMSMCLMEAGYPHEVHEHGLRFPDGNNLPPDEVMERAMKLCGIHDLKAF